MILQFPPSALLPSLKPPLQMALRLAPDRLLSTALATLFTHLLRGQSLAGRRRALDRRGIAISITDPGCELRFRIIDGRVESDWDRSNLAGRDVRLRGRFEDFCLMATREEDPDTLFFNRRLAIEGDTETGLTLKNLLDGGNPKGGQAGWPYLERYGFDRIERSLCCPVACSDPSARIG